MSFLIRIYRLNFVRIRLNWINLNDSLTNVVYDMFKKKMFVINPLLMHHIVVNSSTIKCDRPFYILQYLYVHFRTHPFFGGRCSICWFYIFMADIRINNFVHGNLSPLGIMKITQQNVIHTRSVHVMWK